MTQRPTLVGLVPSSIVVTPVSDAHQSILRRYLEEIEVWNSRMNLTRVPREEWWRRHIDESVELCSLIDESAVAIADLGSGAGLPGIPIAVVRPRARVTLIEADKRKAGFLLHVAGVLGLENVTVLAERAEVAGHDERQRERHDTVVSRATAELRVLVELALPLLRVGGTLLALTTDSAASAAEAARICGGGPPADVAPGVVSVAKARPTDPAYPRSAGIPSRRPL